MEHANTLAGIHRAKLDDGFVLAGSASSPDGFHAVDDVADCVGVFHFAYRVLCFDVVILHDT
ncbi:MAG: hypothetical protein EBU82_12625 [Flavobacteriia bacterium]|nr:hypothetical protein [Flavobacteriia bacterium]